MANLNGLGLDPNVTENLGEFVVLPHGKYDAVIINDELVDTKNKKGKILNLTLQIVSGTYLGEKIIDRINIVHENMQTQAIGQGRLKGICGICNVTYPPSETKKLYGIPFTITVAVEQFKSNKTGNMINTNKVKAYAAASKKADEKQIERQIERIESW